MIVDHVLFLSMTHRITEISLMLYQSMKRKVWRYKNESHPVNHSNFKIMHKTTFLKEFVNKIKVNSHTTNIRAKKKAASKNKFASTVPAN